MSISKTKYKEVKRLIKSLQLKKYRKEEQCFVVQGAKSIRELLDSSFEVVLIAGTTPFIETLKPVSSIEVLEATEKELEEISEYQSNDAAVAVARLKPNNAITLDADAFGLVLDDIRDPGNLGTIIRTADWYGITSIIASEETADFYNPKVISATMGSFTRVNMFYTDLPAYLQQTKGKIFGAYLDGENVHQTDFGTGGLIVIGNESRGISSALEKYITNKITIPRFGQAESLNAGIATAVILDNVKR